MDLKWSGLEFWYIHMNDEKKTTKKCLRILNGRQIYQSKLMNSGSY